MYAWGRWKFARLGPSAVLVHLGGWDPTLIALTIARVHFLRQAVIYGLGLGTCQVLACFIGLASCLSVEGKQYADRNGHCLKRSPHVFDPLG